MASATVAVLNLSCSREDLIPRAQLTSMQCRSRRPLSVDDIPLVEEFLHRTSLKCDVHETNFGETQSDVFSPRQDSSDNTHLYNGFSRSLGNDLPDASVLPSEVTEFTPNQHSNSIQCRHFMERLFREIYEDIGVCWKRLGRLLIERECVLNNIDADYPDVSEKAFQMLSKWKQMKGQQHATPEALFQAILHIQRADVAERLLKLVPSLFPLAYLLDRIIPSRCKLYNTRELPENFDVKKVLLCRNEKVFICSSKETSHMFVVKKLEDEKNAFAVRKCIDNKSLRQQKRRLRKTEDFVRDLKVKQKMVQDLVGIIEHLQDHLRSQHQAICQRKHTCNNCGQYKTQKDIIQSDLTLLHYELEKMVRGNRRISISGIPSDRIYHLARRTYAVYERHKRMHKRRRTSRRRDCSSSSGDDSDSDCNDVMEGPLMCMSNIIFSIANRSSARTHKVSQSAKTTKTADPNKIKRNKSNSSPSRRSRKNNVFAQENLAAVPCVLVPRDWSGVPPFKLYSNIKASTSKDSSSKETFKAKLLSKEFDERHYELEQGEVFI